MGLGALAGRHPPKADPAGNQWARHRARPGRGPMFPAAPRTASEKGRIHVDPAVSVPRNQRRSVAWGRSSALVCFSLRPEDWRVVTGDDRKEPTPAEARRDQDGQMRHHIRPAKLGPAAGPHHAVVGYILDRSRRRLPSPLPASAQITGAARRSLTPRLSAFLLLHVRCWLRSSPPLRSRWTSSARWPSSRGPCTRSACSL